MPRKQRYHIEWPTEDTVTLFAHLDVIVTDRKKSHCNLDEKETEQDMSMIICQLHDALDKRYTHNEIKQQLLFFFKQSEAYPEYNFRMIFQHGSSEFKALNEDLRCMIALRKEDIVRDSPRKLRYISQYSEAGRDRSSSAQGETLSGTTPQNALSMVSPNVSPHRVTTPGNARRKKKFRQRHALEPSPSITVSKPKRRFANSGIVTMDTSEADSYQMGLNNDTFLGDSDLSPSRNQRYREEQVTITLSHREYEKLQSDLDYFRKKSARAEAEVTQLKRESRSREAFIAKTRGISLEVQDEIKNKDSQIYAEKHKRTIQEFVQPFIASDTKRLVHEKFKKIEAQHSELRSLLLSIPVLSSSKHNHVSKTIRESSDLNGLLPSVLGNDSTSGELADNQLVLSLAGAAVRKWVFQEKFTNIYLTCTPLLEKYRYLISSAWDANVSWGLDLAAHQALIDDDHFQDIVLPRIASTLTERYLAMLELLAEYKPSIQELEKFKSNLQGIFRVALNIKILVILSKELYESIWPTRDSIFDTNIMETERSKYSSEEQVGDDRPSSRVRLVLVPGLRMYSHQRAAWDYCGFSQENETVPGVPWTVGKAVVIA